MATSTRTAPDVQTARAAHVLGSLTSLIGKQSVTSDDDIVIISVTPAKTASLQCRKRTASTCWSPPAKKVKTNGFTSTPFGSSGGQMIIDGSTRRRSLVPNTWMYVFYLAVFFLEKHAPGIPFSTNHILRTIYLTDALNSIKIRNLRNNNGVAVRFFFETPAELKKLKKRCNTIMRRLVKYGVVKRLKNGVYHYVI